MKHMMTIVLAAMTLSSRKVGALIVLERNVGLQNYIETGVSLRAALSYDLLVTIFDPHTPLHDGAVIIRNSRVEAASCFLPLTLNPRLSKELGTRHRGSHRSVTEDTDAAALVVSEETGVISFVQNGEITRYFKQQLVTRNDSRLFRAPAKLSRSSRGRRGGAKNTDSHRKRLREQISELLSNK
jgi:diadenylate cyclase